MLVQARTCHGARSGARVADRAQLEGAAVSFHVFCEFGDLNSGVRLS